MKKLGPLSKRKSVITIGIFISLIVAACDKENEPSKAEINEKILAGPDSKTWLVVSSTVNGTETLLECVRDDYWTFKRTKQVSRENQTTLCTNGFPNNETSSWSFGNDGSWLTFFGGTYEITSLTENEMKLTFPSGGKTYIDTFVRK